MILDAVLRIFSVFFRVSTGPLNDSDLCWNTPMVSEDTTFYEYSLHDHFVEYSLVLQHSVGIHWSDSSNTLRVFLILSSIRHTTGIIEDLLCF